MADPTPKPLRADARRNREALLAAARAVFAEADGPVALDAVARAAGVANGTLYRHFPTREDLVEAVYRDEIQRLHDDATALLVEHPPATALVRWTGALADWAATKHGMADALGRVVTTGRVAPGEMRAELVSIVERFLMAGQEAGDLRGDARPEDVAAVLAGVLAVAGAPDQQEQARRMLALVVDGLRTGPGSARSTSSPGRAFWR